VDPTLDVMQTAAPLEAMLKSRRLPRARRTAKRAAR
jgi:hypothetical protein